MADSSFEESTPRDAAREAWRATDALLAKVAADRRRARLVARLGSRDMMVDLVAAMATYTGLTVAAILCTIYGVQTAVGLLTG